MLAFLVLIILLNANSTSFFNMLSSQRGLYDRRLEIYRMVPPAEDSMQVDSKEYFF